MCPLSRTSRTGNPSPMHQTTTVCHNLRCRNGCHSFIPPLCQIDWHVECQNLYRLSVLSNVSSKPTTDQQISLRHTNSSFRTRHHECLCVLLLDKIPCWNRWE